MDKTETQITRTYFPARGRHLLCFCAFPCEQHVPGFNAKPDKVTADIQWHQGNQTKTFLCGHSYGIIKVELNCIVNCYKTERLISSWQLPHTPTSTLHLGNVTLSHNIRYVYFSLLKRVSIVKSSNYRSVVLADDHGGDSLHVLQSVGVKVHQELPHPGPHRGERELDRRCPTWSYSTTEEKERETEFLVPLYC